MLRNCCRRECARHRFQSWRPMPPRGPGRLASRFCPRNAVHQSAALSGGSPAWRCRGTGLPESMAEERRPFSERRFTRSGHIPVTGLQAPTEICTTSGFRKGPVDTVLTGQAALNLRALRIDRTPARRSELVLHNLELSRFHLVRNRSSNLTDSRHLNEIFFDTL